MTIDPQSTGRQAEGGRVSRRLRAFRPTRASRLRVAAVGSALCLAAGMGISMASQASAAPVQPPPGGGYGGATYLPVCVTPYAGVLRLALPPSTCHGVVYKLALAPYGGHYKPGINTYVKTKTVYAGVPDALDSSRWDLTADARCKKGDVATGGGFSVKLPGNRVEAAAAAAIPYVTLLNAPTTKGKVSKPGQEPTDWTAGIRFGGPMTGTAAVNSRSLVITAYVVCTKGARRHHH